MHAVLATGSSAPADWLWGTLGAVVFVILVALPAAALNSRDRKRRRQAEQASAP